MSYDDEVAADTPVIWLKLNEASGDPIDSGSAATAWSLAPGANQGDASIRLGSAHSSAANGDLENGVCSYVPLGTGASTGLASAVEFWLDAPDADIFCYFLVGVTAGGFSEEAIGSISDGAGSPGRVMSLNLGPSGGVVTYTLTPGKHHVVVSNDGAGTQTYYLDGTSVGTDTTEWAADTVWTSIALGGFTVDGVTWIPGYAPPDTLLFSDFALYGAALSADRIAAHYAAGAEAASLLDSAGVGHCSITAAGPTVSLRSDGIARVGIIAGSVDILPYTEESTVPTRVYLPNRAIVVNGTPVTPELGIGVMDEAGSLIQGPTGIRAYLPNPTNSGTGAPIVKPPVTAKPWTGRWTVDDLPDPVGGFYWLGDPSPYDDTEGSLSKTHQWKAHSTTPSAPSWHSHYPFKPSVTAVDHWLQGGGVVHHPKGVNFNSHFIEHMWLDWGRSRPQPWTWILTGMITHWPSETYAHHILDAGSATSDLHGVDLTADACNSSRKINDAIGYRSNFSVARHLTTGSANDVGADTIRNQYTTRLIPVMWIMQFDGSSSFVGTYSTYLKKRGPKGTVAHGPAQTHRHWIMGRQQNYLAQNRASDMLMFEMRYWDYILSAKELDDQYGQLSSTYQFSRYKNG